MNIIVEPETGVTISFTTVNNVGSKTLFNPVFIDNLIVFSRVSSAVYSSVAQTTSDFPVVLLILKCLSGKDCCVTIVIGSNNMWKAKIAKVNRLKLDLVRIFKIFYYQIK